MNYFNSTLGNQPPHTLMRSTKLSEALPSSSPDGIARLERISYARRQPDAHVKKWPRATRMAFLIVSALASWAVIIGLLAILF